ncbi:pseudouridylate synthase [bacterium]|nr:pseudouridylate synthase [bacterium]
MPQDVNPLEIIYQDEYYIAINKPSGLLIHPSIIDRHEKLNAIELLQEKLGQKVYIIHRLDKPTSGVVLFALNSEAARKGADAFSEKEVKKTYLAVVRGFADKQGLINSPLSDISDKLLDKKKKRNDNLRPAITGYRKIAQTELPVLISRHPISRYSLLEVHPQTGRMHQIRRHLKRVNHPIIGDTVHGDHKHNHYFRDNLNCPRLLLASTELIFLHPYHKNHLKLTARLDKVFCSILRLFDWQQHLPDEWVG